MDRKKDGVCRWFRVDDRLIHGQVTTGWRQNVRFERIWVVDEETAADMWLCEVLHLAGEAAKIPIEVLTVTQGVAREGDKGRILILFKSPLTALQWVREGGALRGLTIGNLAAGPGRRRVWGSVSLGAEERAALDALEVLRVPVTFQATPHEREVAWRTLARRKDRR